MPDLFLQVMVPKRSQSSQDMAQLHHRSAKATPSLASTPEKDTDPSEDPDNGQKASLQGAGQAPNGQSQKAGGLGWGVMSRVASGLLGSGSKKGVPDKKVSRAVSATTKMYLKQNPLITGHAIHLGTEQHSDLAVCQWPK